MTPTNPESRVAGMWRSSADLPLIAGNYVVRIGGHTFSAHYKISEGWLFVGGPDRIRLADGTWWLDESPGAILQCSNQVIIGTLRENERLTADLAATRAQLVDFRVTLEIISEHQSIAGAMAKGSLERNPAIKTGGANGKG